MKSEPLAIVEVRSATQVAAFVPMTTLPKPKKRKTPFNTFDAEPKSKTMQRNSHKAALRYATGIKS